METWAENLFWRMALNPTASLASRKFRFVGQIHFTPVIRVIGREIKLLVVLFLIRLSGNLALTFIL
jgi:hypothetical protein